MFNEKSNDKVDKNRGWISTIGVHLILLFVLNFFVFEHQDPPKDKSLPLFGGGSSSSGVSSNESPLESTIPAPPINTNANSQTNGDIPINSENKPSNSPASDESQPDAPSNQDSGPTGNRAASGSFSHSTNSAGGNGQSATGLESGEAVNTGQGGSQGNFGLAGRGMDKGVTPESGCQISGTVILNIWVNREGKVIDVETAAGTTITDSCPIDRAKAAARGTKFTPNPNGPESQKGWIKYTFSY
jgi:TonB family protein